MSHLSTDRLEALLGGADPTDDELDHLDACPTCREATMAPDVAAALSALREAPPEIPKELLVRAEAGVHAALSRRKRTRWIVGGAALAAAAAAVLALRGRDPRPHVEIAAGGAKVETVQAGADEMVRLDGTATFRVEHLAKGTRFRVTAGADEVEVRGTVFTVVGGTGGVREVAVEEGVVEVRTTCCGHTTLTAGQRWQRPTEAAAPAEPAPSGEAPVAVAPPPPQPDASVAATAPAPAAAAASSKSEEGRELLTTGTAAFDRGEWDRASTLLTRAVQADPGAGWARDARVLAAAARVLGAPLDAVPGMGVGPAAFDAAEKRAAQRGDAARAALCRFGAARSLSGDAAKKRMCALAGDGALPAKQRDEAKKKCTP